MGRPGRRAANAAHRTPLPRRRRCHRSLSGFLGPPYSAGRGGYAKGATKLFSLSGDLITAELLCRGPHPVVRLRATAQLARGIFPGAPACSGRAACRGQAGGGRPGSPGRPPAHALPCHPRPCRSAARLGAPPLPACWLPGPSADFFCRRMLLSRRASLDVRIAVTGAEGGPLLQVVVAGRGPLLAWYEAAWTPAPPAAAAEGAPAGGAGCSWRGRWSAPPPPAPRPCPTSPSPPSTSRPRLQALVCRPAGHLALAADGLGRVLLVDVRLQCVVRMWKGYRDAQAAFLGPRHAVLYAARRGLLEIWCLRHGARLAAYSALLPWPRLIPLTRLLQTSASAAGSSAASRKARQAWGARGTGPLAASCCIATRGWRSCACCPPPPSSRAPRALPPFPALTSTAALTPAPTPGPAPITTAPSSEGISAAEPTSSAGGGGDG